MAITRTLRVFPNPYLALDHEGRPAGACPCDPLEHIGDELRYVGASRAATLTRKADAKRGLDAQHDYAWTFSCEPELLPSTDYYRKAIRRGELFAADAETWSAAGCDPALFVDAKTALAHAKEGALATWRAHYGDAPCAAAKHWSDFLAPSKAASAPAAHDYAHDAQESN